VLCAGNDNAIKRSTRCFKRTATNVNTDDAAAATWDAPDRLKRRRRGDSGVSAHGDQGRVPHPCIEFCTNIGVVPDQSDTGDEQPWTCGVEQRSAGSTDIDGWRGGWAYVGCVSLT
jgi:hypothetical protein